jgi:hypothetical protein
MLIPKKDYKMEKKEIKGLIRLRRVSGSVPTFECSNCKCKRYSPCTCKKAKEK